MCFSQRFLLLFPTCFFSQLPAFLFAALNFGLRLRVFLGPLVMVVLGAAASGVLGVWTANERVATAELPAASVVAELTGGAANDLYRAVTKGAQDRAD